MKTKTEYFDSFEAWMLRAGRIDKYGEPSEGLSPRTAKNRLRKIRKILVDLGYVGVKKLGYRYRYSLIKDIRELAVAEIEEWFKENFPTLPNPQARFRKADYAEAVYKFADFLHHDLEYWAKEDVELVRKRIKRPWVPPSWENKIEILPTEKIDEFLEYLKSISRMHHMMGYMMRHANMRYIEVVNARADIKSGTLVEDFDRNMVIIYGKGRGGLTQRRTTPFLPENQAEFKDFMRWREEQGIKSEWLFVTKYSRKWSDHSCHFNEWLREKGKNFGFTDDEAKLLTTHKVGRHAYGTDMTLRGLPERFLCDNMGIRNTRILTRYQNATDELRVQETMRRLNGNCLSANSSLKIATQNCNLNERKIKLVDMLIGGEIEQDTFKIAIGSV